MKILLYEMGAYTQNDLIYFLNKHGIETKNIYYAFADLFHDAFFNQRFTEYLVAQPYDCVMSINYFPLVAEICYKHNIKYLAWSYDSPLDSLFYDTFHYPTNYIFLFDRIECEKLWKKGHKNIYHMPLAVNTERLFKVSVSQADYNEYAADISFVGQLYYSSLPALTASLSDYDKGYIDSIVQSQFKLYGAYVIDTMLPADLIARIQQANPTIDRSPELARQQITCAIANYITRLERLVLLNELGKKYKTNLYSFEQTDILKHIPFCGSVTYFDNMPKVFKCSKLNLNPTLKSIQSGIPLRALDILGSGGLLFSNYQLELAEHFQSGIDVVMYTSMEDALEQAAYYLKHEESRQDIIKNGYFKVKQLFNYEDQLRKIFQIAGI